MAAPTGTFRTNDSIGQREDLTDVIYEISPTQTPFMNGIGRTEATAILHEWQTDSLAAAASNSELEGFDVTGQTSTATVRVQNYCQIMSKDVVVSRTQRRVMTAGRRDEFPYQIAKRGRELKRDMEFNMLANTGQNAGNDASARVMRGLPSWLDSNTNFANCGADATIATDARTDATAAIRALTEALVDAVLESCFESGGEPTMLMVSGVNKQVVSDFTGRASARQMIAADRIQAAADLYAGDFGNLSVVPNRFQRKRDVFLIDPDMAAVAFLDPILQEDLAKTGDADKKLIVTEFTLQVNNEAAHGGIFDILHCHS